jgi:translocation and assembly module TamB
MSRFRVRWRSVAKYFASGILLVLLLISAALWYVTTDSFQQMVRKRLTAELERITGGRIELGSFHVVPLRFQVEVRNLTIHGREAPAEIPYVHIDSMSAVVNLSSALGGEIGFHSLTLEHPVVHLIFYGDGSTNQPTPVLRVRADYQQLLALSINRLDVRRGELLWQDQRIPMDFTSNDIAARLNYSFLRGRYSGNLRVGRIETQFDGYRPVAWTAQSTFAIDRSGLQIQSLIATAERTRLQFDGQIANFFSPTIKGSYLVDLDLEQFGAISRNQQIQTGRIVLTGDGSWSEQTFSSAGKFEAKNVGWKDKRFSMDDVSSSGDFSIDPQRIALSKIEGKAFGGTFTSELEVVNWKPSIPKKAQNREQRGILTIKVRNVSLAEVLSRLGPPFRPANKLKLSAAVSGTSEMRWRSNLRDAEITAAVELSRPPKVRAGESAVQGGSHLNYSSQSEALRFSDLSIITPATQILGAGAMASPGGIKLSFVTTDLNEWQPVTAALFPSGLPVVVHGRTNFSGIVAGKFSAPVIAGNLQLENFETLPELNLRQRIHWDSLAAEVKASSRNLTVHNAVLHRGDETLKLDGSLGLSSWKLAAESPFNLTVNIQNMNAADLATLGESSQSVSGRISGDVELSGTLAEVRGQANVNLTRASIREYTVDSATAQVGIEGPQLTFRSFSVASGESRVSGNGTYDLASHRFELDVKGSNFDLVRISSIERSRIRVGGRLDFSARGSGTLEEPAVSANLRFRNVTLNEETAGNFFVDAVSHGPDLRLTGHSDSRTAELQVSGDARLRDRWPARINFHFNRLDVDPFLESYLHGHVSGHSSVAGDLLLEGPLRDPQLLRINGNLTDLYAEVQKVKLRSDGPIRFNVSERELKLENVHIIGENTDFSGSGTAIFGGERGLDFQIHGKVDLRLVQTYNPDLNGSGIITGDAHIGGTLNAPQVKGRMEVQNGAIADINLPSALSEINGTFLFSQNQVTIDRLSARTGGGKLSFTGHAELVGKQVNFDLNASASDVRLRYPPGVSSTADAELHWNGSSAGSTLSGDITVTKLGFTPGFDFGSYLERAAQVSSIPQTDPMLNNIRLDLHVVTAPELQMQTSVIRLQGEADLRVRGNAARPALLGRADIFEGEAYFNGTKYRLERGGVTFGTPAASASGATTPFVDLQATTRVRDYDVILSMTGPADKPKLNYRSDPPLPTNDIISLLAFGQTTEESASLQQSSQSAFSQQASNALLAAALNATLNSRTQRLFGNSRIKIDPQGLTTETSTTQSGPAVSIEQQVKDNLTLTYTTNVAQTSQQVIRAEYNVSRTVSIVAIRDQNGIVSFDVTIRRRKR